MARRHKRYDGSPESRPDKPIKRDTLVPMEDSVAERYITTQTPATTPVDAADPDRGRWEGHRGP